MAINIPFIKMNGAGNDFVVIDNRSAVLPPLNWNKIADRNFGIGCDQIVILEKSQKADIYMRIINADGSEVSACGNATRCVALLVAEEKPSGSGLITASIETKAGIMTAEITDTSSITINMGIPGLGWQNIPLAKEADTLHLPVSLKELSDPVAVSMGNPHMVFFTTAIDSIKLDELGIILERHDLFPQRTNVEVAHIVSENEIDLRVWERGTGLTLACGTGACATLVAASLRGLTGRKAKVNLPGDSLGIHWRESDNNVLMTGSAAVNYTGSFDPGNYRS